ncbi:myogenesis-regulating glycosidase-like [Diadema setosum]|uniref:myogenesis-regulating glycosidase-like n=1 Tax=Diadema setosum TaxID=31175 RepID=UPI003B3B3A10
MPSDRRMPCPMCHISKKQRQGLMVLSVVIVIFAVLSWYYVTQHGRMAVHHLGPVSFHPGPEQPKLYITRGNDIIFEAELGVPLPVRINPQSCTGVASSSDSICINWVDTETDSMVDKELAMVQIDLKPKREEDRLQCITVNWTSHLLDFEPMDCIALKHAHWYGGASVYRQHWPMDDMSIRMQPYVSRDILIKKDRRDVWGSVLENYWLSSMGVAIHVDDDVPLHVGFNEDGSEKLCLKSKYLNSPYQNTELRNPHLSYTICFHDDVKAVHQHVYKKWFSLPSGTPDVRMMKSPIWSTWARYKITVDQEQVLQYAKEIRSHNMTNSQIEIDDKYTTSYGSYDFNVTKFPNASEMINTLHDQGFRVTAWIHPFTNLDSPNLEVGIKGGYWVQDVTHSVPALVKWWQGIGAVLDVTDSSAQQWYVDSLEGMRTAYGIDSFKFDAGEADYFPISYSVASQDFRNPNEFCTHYAPLVSRLGRMIEVRCGHQTQRLPIFVRMFDKESTWGYDNGLQTMIPSALTQGILGYPFILPDMIGGNAYAEDTFTTVDEALLPERELFIRWLELTAYLPAMQFSIAPWQYDDSAAADGVSVVTVAKKMVRIHEEEVFPLIQRFALDALLEGTPIIRPLWWLDPHDKTALTIDSEFLIGDILLVAPILKPLDRFRDIYLPQGNWTDLLRGGEDYLGGNWLREYPIGLDQIATFRRRPT